MLVRPIGTQLAKTKKYRLKYSGIENVPVRGPLIVVANHQTNVDGVAVALAMKRTLMRSRLVPWAKVEIKRGKEGLLGVLLWYFLGTIPIDRDAEEEAPKAIRKSMEFLKKGKIVCVFPEGTRYPRGEVGPFKYGVANLARAAPAPILPVAVYRRDEDGGIQVKIGQPFFMPSMSLEEAGSLPPRSKAEALLRHQLDTLKQWSEDINRDKKGMKLIANMIGLINRTLSREHGSFNRFLKMAHPDDNEFLRQKVMELLPEGWRAVDGGSDEERSAAD